MSQGTIPIPGIGEITLPSSSQSLPAPLEFLDSIGLNTPLRRLGVFGVASYALLLILKPTLMYTAEGVPRRWSVLVPEDTDATPVPDWLAAFMIGAAGALLL